jgi:hypothetical protein
VGGMDLCPIRYRIAEFSMSATIHRLLSGAADKLAKKEWALAKLKDPGIHIRRSLRAVRQLAGFLGRPPDTATVEDLRRFQLHMVGTTPITLNATITGLKSMGAGNTG